MTPSPSTGTLHASHMLPELQQLLVLQEKDQHIRRMKLDLKKLPADQEKAKLRLSEDTEAVKKAKQTLQENEVAIKSLELDIQTRRTSIARLKTQQFETRKNEEYAALGAEIERYGRDVSALEDRELELMEKAEVLKEALTRAEAALAKTKELVDDELKRIGERHGNVTKQLAEMEAQRTERAGKVDPDLLEKYDRIFTHRGDAAIVVLEGGICRGCHMKVTAAVVSAAKAEKSFVFCSNCGRMVYYSEL